LPPKGETQRLEMDRATLTRLAETTRGKFFTLADAHRLVGQLPLGQRVETGSLPPLAIWNRWQVLLLALALLIGEWLVRKRCALV